MKTFSRYSTYDHKTCTSFYNYHSSICGPQVDGILFFQHLFPLGWSNPAQCPGNTLSWCFHLHLPGMAFASYRVLSVDAGRHSLEGLKSLLFCQCKIVFSYETLCHKYSKFESSQQVVYTKHVFSRCFAPDNFGGFLQEESFIYLTNFTLFNR